MDTRKARGRPPHPDILTPGEWRVAEGVRHGLTNAQIGHRQGISPDAAKYHVSNILSKLGMTRREELRVWDGISADSNIDRSTSMGSETVGAIGQIARTVSNIEEARSWHRDVLGLRHLFDAGSMAFFACGDTRLMLVEGDAGPESILYFSVDDLHLRFDELKARGAKVASAPHRIHTHEDGTEEWMGFVEDSDGRPIGLMSLAAPHDAG